LEERRRAGRLKEGGTTSKEAESLKLIEKQGKFINALRPG